MNWYVLSSGLDLDKPPKLTTQQVIQLIIDDTIGKNAKIMQANGGTGKWELIRHNPEFAETFASLRQLRSQEKALAQERQQADKAASQTEQSAAQAQRQIEKANKRYLQHAEKAAAKILAQDEADHQQLSSNHGEYLYSSSALGVLIFSIIALAGGGYIAYKYSNGDVAVAIGAGVGSSLFWFCMASILQHLNIIANGHLKTPRGVPVSVVIWTLVGVSTLIAISIIGSMYLKG